jgi:hypothetical protein
MTGTQAAQAPEPLTALLAEVHALRLALEQSATIAPRVQLTLARLNIEERRVGQLAAALTSSSDSSGRHRVSFGRRPRT